MVGHLWQLIVVCWHSTFMVGAIPAAVMAAAVDYQAFRNFKSFHDLAEYQWGTAAFRWTQAFIGGGLGATIFKGLVGSN